MSDLQANFSPDPVPAQVSGEAIPAGGAGQEQATYLTHADLAAFEEKFERRLQSMTDKQESRLKKQFEEAIAQRQRAYAEMGLTMPESEKQGIAQRIIDASPEDKRQPGQAGLSEGAVNPETVNALAQNIFRKAGISGWADVSPQEIATVRTTGDPDDYLEDVKRVAQAAAARKGQPAQPASIAAAPIIGGGQAGGDRLNEITQRMQLLQRDPGRNRAELVKLGKEQEQLLRSSR